MKQKTVRIIIKAPFWFRLWIAISFLKTGVFEWNENNFYDELIKELIRNDKTRKNFRKRSEIVCKEEELK